MLEEAEAEAEAIEKEVSEWKKIQALKMENGGCDVCWRELHGNEKFGSLMGALKLVRTN